MFSLMSFLNPIAFWGLLLLLIPLIIHLLSKKQKHTIYFGSNRFLEDQETTSANSIQLSDFGLLLLRLLLLAILIFAIAQLVNPDTRMQHIKYIESELVQNKNYESALPSLDSKEQINYFSYNQTLNNEDVSIFPSAYTFINHLNKLKDSISVYTFSEKKYFIGSEQIIHHNIDWNIIPKKESTIADKINDQALHIDILHSSASKAHKNDFVNVVNSIKQFLPFDVNFKKSNEWILMIDTISIDTADQTIYWDTQAPDFSFNKSFDGYKMTGFLSKKNMLSSNFPLALTQALIQSRTNFNMLDIEIMNSKDSSTKSVNEILKAQAPAKLISYANYLWIGLVVLLLAERFFSLQKVKE